MIPCHVVVARIGRTELARVCLLTKDRWQNTNQLALAGTQSRVVAGRARQVGTLIEQSSVAIEAMRPSHVVRRP